MPKNVWVFQIYRGYFKFHAWGVLLFIQNFLLQKAAKTSWNQGKGVKKICWHTEASCELTVLCSWMLKSSTMLIWSQSAISPSMRGTRSRPSNLRQANIHSKSLQVLVKALRISTNQVIANLLTGTLYEFHSFWSLFKTRLIWVPAPNFTKIRQYLLKLWV